MAIKITDQPMAVLISLFERKQPKNHAHLGSEIGKSKIMRALVTTAFAVFLTGCSTADINRLAAGDTKYAAGRLVESMTALAAGESLVPIAGVALPPQGGTWGFDSKCSNGVQRSKATYVQLKPGDRPNSFSGRLSQRNESLAGKSDVATAAISGFIHQDVMIITSAFVTDKFNIKHKTGVLVKKYQVLANGKLRYWSEKTRDQHSYNTPCSFEKIKEENGMYVSDLDPVTSLPAYLDW